MLCLEVVPEEGLQDEEKIKIFLGMHISQAISIFQSQVNAIKTASVLYNETAPLKHDLIVDLNNDGLRLIFDSKSQRLKLIEIYNLKLIKLKYCGVLFNGPNVIPTVEVVDRSFGATIPGSYDKKLQLFALNFRGLTFFFHVDMQFHPHYSHGLGSLRFNSGDASPILSRMLLYSGHNPSSPPVPNLPNNYYKGQIYVEDCQIIRNQNSNKSLGLKLKLFTQSKNYIEPRRIHFEREICFGEDVQSVVSKLGCPGRIFYKSDDKMKIHSRNARKKITNNKSDYFLNYFTLGIDVLIDSERQQVSKFVLHTNFPGHYDFNSYHRCPFSFKIAREGGFIGEKIIKENQPPIIPITQQNANPNPKPSKQGGNNNNGNTPKSPKSKKKNKNNNNNNNNSNNNGGGERENKSYSTNSENAISQQQQQPTKTTSSNNSENDDSPNCITVDYQTLWEEIHSFTHANDENANQERPVVLTRNSSNNPFGTSLCFSVQDLIFEVLPNDHIASLIIFQDSTS